MKDIGTYEVKTHLSQLLDQVEHGESFRITRRGKPVARLVPEAEADRATVRDAVAQLKAFRQCMPKVSADEIREMIHEGHRY